MNQKWVIPKKRNKIKGDRKSYQDRLYACHRPATGREPFHMGVAFQKRLVMLSGIVISGGKNATNMAPHSRGDAYTLYLGLARK